MKTNTIANITTVERPGPEGLEPVIVLGLNIGDPSTVREFLRSVSKAFTTQRMKSPPSTRGMLVTIIGALTSAEFVSLWRQVMAEDPMLKFFMSKMVIADVQHGSSDGPAVVIDSASLIQ